eukprot:COSAG01_NODE_77221_length_168_cov_61.840580_1_plen_22_part_01
MFMTITGLISTCKDPNLIARSS